MESHALGTSGVRLPVLGFGCGPNARLMVSEDRDLQRATIAKALELGIDYFDTAAAYGDGASERNLGRAIREFGVRPAVSTKFLVAKEDLGDIRGAVLRSAENSMGRLGIDCLDAFVLHNRVAWRREPGQVVGIGPLLSIDDVLGTGGVVDALDELRSSGVVRSVGFTGFGGEQSAIDAILATSSFDAVNAEYNVFNASAGLALSPPGGDGDYRSLIDRATSAGAGCMVIRVYGGGQLFDQNAETKTHAGRLRQWMRDQGLPPQHLALRFALGKPGVTTVIVGFSQPEHVVDAASAAAAGALPAAKSRELAMAIATAVSHDDDLEPSRA